MCFFRRTRHASARRAIGLLISCVCVTFTASRRTVRETKFAGYT